MRPKTTHSKNSIISGVFDRPITQGSGIGGLDESFNMNTTADIKAISIQEVPAKFNIINHPKIKEYHYYFSFGEKNHLILHGVRGQKASIVKLKICGTCKPVLLTFKSRYDCETSEIITLSRM